MKYGSEINRNIVFILHPIILLLLLADVAYSQKSVLFSSAGDYISVPHSVSLSAPEFTIEFWLKIHELGDPDIAGGEQTIVDKRGLNETGYNLRLAGTSFPLPIFAFVLPGGVSTNNVIYPHIWNHIAVTQDQDSLKIYSNGVLAGADSNSYAFNSEAELRIGEFLGYPGAYIGLRGEIDELRIWQTARSQGEVQSAMFEKLTGTEIGLVAYWDFDSLTGLTVPDLSSRGNHGTLHGNVKLVDSDAPAGFIPPAIPVGLRAYGLEQAIQLYWMPGGSEVLKYQVHRGDSLDFRIDSTTLLATVSAQDTSFLDTGVSPGQDYLYRLRAADKEQHLSQPGKTALSRTLTVAQKDFITGVYYYPWYGPGIGGHDWQGQYIRELLIPQQPPVLGHYSSRNPEVIQQHLDWIQTYGIEFLVSSWWGQNSWEDITLRDFILPELENTPVKFTIYYESAILGFDQGGITINAEKEEQLINDFTYIAETYFSHPNILKVEDKPVVFIYLSSLFSGNYEPAFVNVRSAVLGTGFPVFLVGDEVGWGESSQTHMRFLDAVSPYIMFGNPEYEGYPANRDFFSDISVQAGEWEKTAHSENKFVIPNVHPGFNNRAVGNAFVGPRKIQKDYENTSMLAEYIKVMRPFIDPTLKMIMITSWNEWHEDTQIEPTITTSVTNGDNSGSGNFYTQGYGYKGYGEKPLEVIRELLGYEQLVPVEEKYLNQIQHYELLQNYPNPFDQFTTISYFLPKSSNVRLTIYNLAGQVVKILVNEQKEPGIHKKIWTPDGVGSGVYFCKFSADKYSEVRKIVFLK